MRRNIWIGFFIVGAQTLPAGLSLLGAGIWFYLFLAPLLVSMPIPLTFPFMDWLFIGMTIGGSVLTSVGIAFIAFGYKRYSAEAELDQRKGFSA